MSCRARTWSVESAAGVHAVVAGREGLHGVHGAGVFCLIGCARRQGRCSIIWISRPGRGCARNMAFADVPVRARDMPRPWTRAGSAAGGNLFVRCFAARRVAWRFWTTTAQQCLPGRRDRAGLCDCPRTFCHEKNLSIGGKRSTGSWFRTMVGVFAGMLGCWNPVPPERLRRVR